MEFPFNINNTLIEDITILSHLDVNKLISNRRNNDMGKEITQIIDSLGLASARAQNLQSPITSSLKFANSCNRIYIKKSSNCNDARVIGFIKVGTKNLFIFDRQGTQHHMEPLCVLDFYVHESMQRFGYGKQIFEYMTANERVEPSQLAIDRPSSKFISFLSKHYNLKSSIPQANNFLVFENIFTSWKSLNMRGNSKSMENINRVASQHKSGPNPLNSPNLKHPARIISSTQSNRPPSGSRKTPENKSRPSSRSSSIAKSRSSSRCSGKDALPPSSKTPRSQNMSGQNLENTGQEFGDIKQYNGSNFHTQNEIKRNDIIQSEKPLHKSSKNIQDIKFNSSNNLAAINDSTQSGKMQSMLKHNSSWDIFGLQSPDHKFNSIQTANNNYNSSKNLNRNFNNAISNNISLKLDGLILNDSSNKLKLNESNPDIYIKGKFNESHKFPIKNRYQKTSLW